MRGAHLILMSPCAELFARQTAVRPNRALLRSFRIPNAARVNHTPWDKRLVHTGETESQPPDGVNLGVGSSQAHSSKNHQKNIEADRWSRKLVVSIHGKRHRFDSFWLRDACPCERCIDHSTKQKLFDRLDIPTAIQGKDLEVHADGSFSISWTSDIPGYEDHRSCFPPDYYRFNWDVDHAVKYLLQQKYHRRLWDQDRLKDRRLGMNVTYDAYMTDEKAYRNVLEDLIRFGIALSTQYRMFWSL